MHRCVGHPPCHRCPWRCHYHLLTRPNDQVNALLPGTFHSNRELGTGEADTPLCSTRPDIWPATILTLRVTWAVPDPTRPETVRDQQPPNIEAAAIVLPCEDLDACIAFFTGVLHFRIDSIFPADAPSTAVISAHGLRIRLQTEAGNRDPGTILIECADPGKFGADTGYLYAPNGTRIEFAHSTSSIPAPTPQPTFSITRLARDAKWVQGRAGMLYRDLILDRLGGQVIASHIRIPDGGPVPDYVHYHDVRCQVIFCYRGWVRVVYEGQGPDFVLEAGDCVLQPPGIRHRVLECSTGLEVIEVACPAAHATHADHELSLPTSEHYPDRTFSGQRFVRHQATETDWHPTDSSTFIQQETGISRATNDLTDVRVLHTTDLAGVEGPRVYESPQTVFLFVLEGRASLRTSDQVEPLLAGDAVTMPGGHRFELAAEEPGSLKLLEVLLPAD